MNVIPFRRRKEEIKEVILQTNGHIIYVDFVLISMVKSVEDWYIKYYFNDNPWGTMRKAHMYQVIRLYEFDRFKDHKTIGKERIKYLEEVDLYVQMRRDG